ncbi:hypothetical protein DM02DRAFT_547055, partial [Periconia macrospinosa]
MPPRYKNYYDVEERIQECIAEFNGGIYPSIAAAARDYDVPYDRLRRRVNGNDSKITRPSTNSRLNPAQESALRAYIDRCDTLKMPPLVPQLISAAQRILDL